MARSVEDSLTLLETSRSNIVTSLNKKGSNVSSTLKISEVAGKIDGITTKGATIIVTAPDFEGETITATKGSKKFTGVVNSGTCEITVDESGTWTISATSGDSVQVSVSVSFNAELSSKRIYTYVVTQSESDPSKRVAYRDDALGKNPAKMNYSTGNFEYGDWENEFFIKENHVWALDSSGNRYKQCKDNDYSQFIDGTASGYNSTSSPYNFMASFPTCWIWRRMEGNNRVVSIANYKVDSNYKAYGWESEQGYVQDFMYLAAFEGIKVSNTLRSLGGQAITRNEKGDAQFQGAENNGTGWTITDYSKWQVLTDLLVLISKSTDSQKSFGEGNSNWDTDNILSSGTLYNKGQFWGESTGTVGMKAFHVENVWGNCQLRMAGFLVSTDNNILVKTRSPYNTTGSNFSNVGTTTGISGNISAGTMTAYGFIPTQVTGSSDTYECDTCSVKKYASLPTLPHVGGSWRNKKSCGIFNIQCGNDSTYSSGSMAVALAYTPQKNTGITT